jgi:hypothetical protein
MGWIVDLVETSPGHHLAARTSYSARADSRARFRLRIEPPDLVLAQRDRGGGEVFFKLLPRAGSDNWQHAFGLNPATATCPTFGVKCLQQ